MKLYIDDCADHSRQLRMLKLISLHQKIILVSSLGRTLISYYVSLKAIDCALSSSCLERRETKTGKLVKLKRNLATFSNQFELLVANCIKETSQSILGLLCCGFCVKGTVLFA